MAYNVELRTTSSGGVTLHPKTNINMVEGLLGADEKIVSNLLPSWLIGGMKFISTKSGTASLEELFYEIKNWLEAKGLSTAAPYDEFRGKYFVVGGTGLTLIREPTGPFDWSYQDDSDGEANPHEMKLEPGDWIVYSYYSGSSGSSGCHFFSFVNNTYRDARENEKGVIQLATQAETLSGTNDTKAVTPLKATQLINNKLANYYPKSDVYTKSEMNSYLANKQPLHEKLTNLSELPNTSGFVKQSSDGTFSIDNTIYATPEGVMSEINDHITILAADLGASLATKAPKNNPVFTGTVTVPLGAGFVKSSSSGVLSVDNNVVIGVKGDSETTYRTGQVNITKSNIGLGSVNNYGIASESDAKANASSVSNKYMTPQRTKEAIDYWASIPIYENELSVPSDLPEGKLFFVKV